MGALTRLAAAMEDFLEENEGKQEILTGLLDGRASVRKEVLGFYFEVSHFLLINDKLDKNYVIYTQLESDGGFCIRLFCVNPSRNLQECMMRGRSSILFSATLLPIQYYKRLLGAAEGDYEVYARSVFDSRRKGLFIAGDVTSKYTRRSGTEYFNIATYIHLITGQRDGNYMIFFRPICSCGKYTRRTAAIIWTTEEKSVSVRRRAWTRRAVRLFLQNSERKEKGRCLGFACLAGFSARESTLKTTA